jgi:hypothetical protein
MPVTANSMLARAPARAWTRRSPNRSAGAFLPSSVTVGLVIRSLGRIGAPCRDRSRWVSPTRPPNPPCDSHRNGLSMCPVRWSAVDTAAGSVPWSVTTALDTLWTQRCRGPGPAGDNMPPAPLGAVWGCIIRTVRCVERHHTAPVFTGASSAIAIPFLNGHTAALPHVRGSPALGVLRRLRPIRAFGWRRAYPQRLFPGWKGPVERTRTVPTFAAVRSTG